MPRFVAMTKFAWRLLERALLALVGHSVLVTVVSMLPHDTLSNSGLRLFSIDAQAASVTYHTQHSNGLTVAPGITTNWGSCGSGPTSKRDTLMSTAAFDCGDDEVTLSNAGIHFESYFNTAYGTAKTVTGTSYDAEFDGQGSAWTFRATLFYVDGAGTKTSLGAVTQAMPSGKLTTTVDLSSISGTVPSGAKLGFRSENISSNASRMRIGSSFGGNIIVDEATAVTTISGTVYTDEGATNIGAGKTVRLVVNGASAGTNTTNASGQYSISATVSAGDAILVYVDQNDGTANDGTTVTVNNGANLSGLDIYVDHVIARHDNAAVLTNALMSTAKGAYSDAEILYSVSSGDLTVNGAATELYVPTGHGYTPGGNVTTQHVQIEGTWNATGSEVYTVSGDWEHGNGTFNYANSTIDMTGTGTLKIDNASWWTKPIYNLTAAAAGQTTTVFTGKGITVANVLTLGTGTVNGGDINLNKGSGTPLVTAGATLSNTVFKYDGNPGPITVAGTTYPNLWLAATGAASVTFNLGGDISCANLNLYGNQVNRTSVLDTTVNDYNITCNQLRVGHNGFTDDYATLKLNNSTVDISGDLTIYPSDGSGTNIIDADNATINVGGNWGNSDTFTADTSTVVFDGGNQMLSGSTTFNNLSKTESSNDSTDVTLTFDNTATQMVNGTLTLDGLDADDRINLVSNSPTNQWSLTLGATATKGTMDYLEVTDSDASGSDAAHKPLGKGLTLDGGNNIDWFGTTTLGNGIGPFGRDVWAGGRFFGVDAFTLQTAAGTDVLEALTTTFSGTDVNDVAASGVMLWRDDGGTANQWDPTDTLIATTSFSGATATFAGLSESINTSATQYIITYNIDSAAVVTDTLQGAVTAATVSNALVNNDNVDATLTVEADSVHETAVYKIGYSPNAFEDLLLKETSSPTTDFLSNMSLGSIYSTTPGSLVPAWDPDASVTTVLNNSVVKQVQMSGDLIDSAGATYGTVTTMTNFYEDRVVLDIDMNITTNPAGTDTVFMSYGTWDDAVLDETLWWSSNNSDSYSSEDPPPNNTGTQTAPITFQWLLELGATDGLLNGTLQNISSYATAALKHNDSDAGTVDVAYQKTNPGTGNKRAVVIYSFNTTTSGYDTDIAEARQDDSVTPAILDFTLAGGDGALVGDGFAETRGAYTLSDGDADDHVKFQFQNTTTHYAPVFEIGGWSGAAPATLLVGDAVKTLGVDYNGAVSGGTLYLQYLGNILANTVIEIGDELITGTLYSDEGTTAVGAGVRVRLLVNGVAKGLDETSATGQFSFATPLSAADKLLVYVDEDDADGATDGTTVTVSDGNNLTGLDVYYQHLIARHDNAGALTNALMKTAVEPYVDTEILYSVDGGNNLSAISGAELFVPTGHTFAPGANVTTQGAAGNVDLRGTLTAGANTITVTGDWDSSTGTFNRDTSTLVLNGTSNTFTPKDDQNFHNLTVGAGADITVVSFGGADNFVVYETVTIDGSISVPAGFTMTQRFSVPGTTTTIGAAGILTGAGTFERIVYKPVLTFINSTGITISNFTYRLTYTNDNVVTIPAVTYGGDLYIVAHSASSVAEAVTIAAGTLTVGGNLFIESSTNDTTSTTLRNSDNDSTVNVTGNLTVGNATTSGDTSFVTGNATVTVGGNVTLIDDAESDNAIIIDASDGTPTLSVSGNWDSSGGTFTYGTSTVDLTGTANLTTSGTQYSAHFYNLNGAAATKITTLQSHVGVANTLTLGAGTVTGAYELGMLANSGTPLSNAGATLITSAIYYRPVNGTVTVTGGTYTAALWLWPSGSNATFNLGGDITINGDITIDVDTGNSGVVVNTQNNAITATRLDFGESGYDGSSTFNAGSSIIDLSIGGLRSGSNGGSHTLNLDSATITNAGVWLAANGTGLLTVNPGTSTVTLDGTISKALTSGGSAFNNLAINKTDAGDANDNVTIQTNDLTVNGTLTITDGELIQTRSITTGTVTLSDASSKWTNVTDNANVTLSSTVANTGTITFDAPTGDLIQIRSSVGGTQRNWQGTGTFSMTDVDVQDQTALGGTPANIVVSSGTNTGNNINWLFGTKSIGGTVYTDDDEATTLNNKAIKIIVYDGSLQTTYVTSTNGAGAYSITSIALANTDIVAVYLDNEAEEGTTVFKSDGNNVANLNVYQNHVSIRSDSGAISNAEIATADDADDDQKYNVVGNDITLDANYELFVFGSSNYTPGGNVTTQGATGDVDIRGTVNAGANTFTVSGDWDSSNGDWNANTSTVDLTGSGTVKQYTVASPWANGFYNLILAAASQITTLTSTNLWVSYMTTGSGTFTDAANSYTVILQGTGNVFTDGGATLTFNSLNYRAGNYTQNVVGRDYTGINLLEFDTVGGASGSGIYEMQGNVVANDMHIQINNSPTNTRNSILNTNNYNITADNFYVGVNGGTDDYAVLNAGSSTVDINGEVVIYPTDGNGDNVLNAGMSSWTVSGNWTDNDVFTAGTSTVALDGTNQSITGATTFYNLTKAVTSADTLTFQAGQTQTIAAGGTLSFTGTAGKTQTIAAGGTLSFTGTAGNLLQLRSSTPGTEWFLTVNAGVAPIANYVDVKDSNAAAGQTIYAYYSTDAAPGGTNTNWVFGQQLQLVKQVWDASGSTCLASVPSDGACSGGATAVAVPAGNPVYFLIYVRNPMAVSAPDVRFQDLLDDTAFSYQTGTLQRTLNDGTAGQPSDVASAAAMFAAATIAQTDAYDGDTQVDEFAGIDTTASPDDLTVGGNGGAGQNDTLAIPAHKSFGIRFRAVRN